MTTSGRTRAIDLLVGGFAIAAITLHDATHVEAGHWYDAFWLCNIAALLVGPAVLLRSRVLAAVALTWLVPGTVVWLSDAALAGSHILPTSWAVHVGGSLAALYGVRRAGYAPRGWLAALGLLAAAVLASRALLPAAPNVNAAFRVPAGWSFLGGSYAGFAVAALAIVATVCALGQLLCRAVTRPIAIPKSRD